MGYFSNGSEGMDYEERYCKRCIHYGPEEGPGCPIWFAHLVYAYVLREYRPRAVFGGHWFWQRARAPLRVGARTARGAVAAAAGAPAGAVRLTGWVALPSGARWAYVTVGAMQVEIAPLRPLGDGRAAFGVLAPVAFLPPGERNLGIAVHDPRTDELLRVCSNC